MSMLTEQQINDAYARLATARSELVEATEWVGTRRAQLAQARAEAFVAGHIEGRNEAERESRARALLADHFAALDSAESTEGRAKLALELARFEIERIQTLIRFLALPQIPPRETRNSDGD